MNIRTLVLMCTVTTSLSACGGGGDGGGDGAVDPNSRKLAPGSYQLTFSASSTARLAAPISGIDVAVRFPAGISVSTTTGGTGQIVSTSVTSGSAIYATSLAFGSYSASTRTAYLTMATTLDTYRGGQFLNLLFTVAAGASVAPNDIFTLNAIYPQYKVVGLDTVSHNSVNMTGSVRTTLGVTP